MADVRLSPQGPELRQVACGVTPAVSPNMLTANLGLSPIRNVPPPAEAPQESQPELGQVPSTPQRDWRSVPALQPYGESPTLKFSDRRTPASARLYVASPNAESRNLWRAIDLSDSLHTPRLDRGHLDSGGGLTMVTITVPHSLGPDRMHRFEFRGMSYDLQMPDYAQPGTELQVELLPFPPNSPFGSMKDSGRPEDTWRMLPPFTQPPYDRWIAETQRLREIEAKKDNELRLELKRKLQILEERYQAERGHMTRQDEIKNLEVEVCQAELKICEQQQDIARVSELNESLRRLQETHDSFLSEQKESLRQLQETQDGARCTTVGSGVSGVPPSAARNQPENTSPVSAGDSVPEATVPKATNPESHGNVDAAPVAAPLAPPLSLASAPASPDLVVKRELKDAATHDVIPSLVQLGTSSMSLPVQVPPGELQNGLALPRQNGNSVTLPVKELMVAAMQPSLSAVPPVITTASQVGAGIQAPLLSAVPPAVSKTPGLPMPAQLSGYPFPQRMKSNTSSPRLMTRDTLPFTTAAMRIVRQFEGFSSAASRAPSRSAPGEPTLAPTVQPSPQLTTRSINVPPPTTRPTSLGFQVGRASGSTSAQHMLTGSGGAPAVGMQTVISPRYRPLVSQGAAASGTSAPAQVGGALRSPRGLSPKFGQRQLPQDTHAQAPHPPRRSLQVTRPPPTNARDMSQQGRSPSPSFRQQSYRASLPGLRQVVVQDAIRQGISKGKRPS